MSHVAAPVHPAVLRYARGEINLSRAVDQFGPDATKHDVIAAVLEAGLPLPEPPEEVTAAELARARRALGIAPRG